MKYNCEICNAEINKSPAEYKRSKHHYCSKRCFGEWRKTQRLSEESKKKISVAKTGIAMSEETKRKISLANKGNPKVKYWLGRKRSKESIAKSALGNIGNKSHTGRALSEQHRKNISKSLSGENSYLWRGGITDVNAKARHSFEYKEWRRKVFERDSWACVWCGSKKQIQADHIKPFSVFIDLRHEISNGRTLCFECHKKTDTYAMKVQNINKLFPEFVR